MCVCVCMRACVHACVRVCVHLIINKFQFTLLSQAMEKAVREINEEGIFSVFIILDPLQKVIVLI